MKQKAFTLIELLVVMAIIGVIASIVLVNLRGSREKAMLARGLQFSHSLNHALGAYAVGIWNFNDSIADNEVTDTSGHNNHGVVQGGATQEDSLQYSGGSLGKALMFDGNDDYVVIDHKSILDLNHEFTIEAWVYYMEPVAGDWLAILGKGGGDSYTIKIKKSDREVRFWGTIGGGSAIHAGGCGSVSVEGWTHVGVTYTGNTIYCFVNGNMGDIINVSGAVGTNTNPLLIGDSIGAGRWHGKIDEVKIYYETFTVQEIQKHYAEGLEKHELAEK